MARKSKPGARKKVTSKESKLKRGSATAKASNTHAYRIAISKEITTPKKNSAKATAEKAYRKYANEIVTRFAPYGVHNISYGQRIKNGVPVNEQVIRLHVKFKKQKSALKQLSKEMDLEKRYGVGIDIVVGWGFKTSSGGASTGEEQPDGTGIRVGNRRGTLGTTVYIKVGGKRAARWLTAAHVVSRPNVKPTTPVPIKLLEDGREIGTVSNGGYFRDQFVDVAFIEPNVPLDPTPTFAIPLPLTSADHDAIVTMKGGATPPGIEGKISLLEYNGTVGTEISPGNVLLEHVERHFLVEGVDSQRFAQDGDSGATIAKEGLLIGLVRAAFDDGTAVVTRIHAINKHAMEFVL